ncbi:hypothetical protein D9757_010358 [Collybiopsis confluens]|uniref:Restriction of telomere capping protein 4 n=1 Tax=Collybiopsis confluens TaxID=2823264 RepID=A0A8H5LL61_9AGAR|nr:hypothetical protein D9757_015222 [Collybiopsis confluens]KAF5361580.1 hypothetical protein D9757_011562 [Collybiopsis confluens]KAF5367824.1 hypothetical protein D9757_010358 [Collybiopsis confluens]
MCVTEDRKRTFAPSSSASSAKISEVGCPSDIHVSMKTTQSSRMVNLGRRSTMKGSTSLITTGLASTGTGFASTGLVKSSFGNGRESRLLSWVIEELRVEEERGATRRSRWCRAMKPELRNVFQSLSAATLQRASRDLKLKRGTKNEMLAALQALISEEEACAETEAFFVSNIRTSLQSLSAESLRLIVSEMNIRTARTKAAMVDALIEKVLSVQQWQSTDPVSSVENRKPAPFPVSQQSTMSEFSSGVLKTMHELENALSSLPLIDETEDDANRDDPNPDVLCPYCDEQLPEDPSPYFRELLARCARKSYSQPRPSNPKGRKAPVDVFVEVCSRHRLEKEMIPEAMARGWPIEIDWSLIPERVNSLKNHLEALLQNSGDTSGLLSDGGNAREKCVFWREVMDELREKRQGKLKSVDTQFLSLRRSQPGYYGEVGLVLIHRAIEQLFPMQELEPAMLHPLGRSEFISRILVPEAALCLILEDFGLSGGLGEETALEILRASISYGVAMFPDDLEREYGDSHV